MYEESSEQNVIIIALKLQTLTMYRIKYHCHARTVTNNLCKYVGWSPFQVVNPLNHIKGQNGVTFLNSAQPNK